MPEESLGSDHHQYQLSAKRWNLLQSLLPSATKLSFDSFVQNITELHVCIKVHSSDCSEGECFDFTLTDNVQYDWFFRPRPRYVVSAGSNFTDMLLTLLEEYCSGGSVDTLYFGTCRFLDVPRILRHFQADETNKNAIHTLEIFEWSGFHAALHNKYDGLMAICSSLTSLSIGAFNTRNQLRRKSVNMLMELASWTGQLQRLVFAGGDYVVPALEPLLRANPELQILHLGRHKILEHEEVWSNVLEALQDVSDLTEVVLDDVSMSNPMPVYRAILTSKCLRKLHQKSITSTVGHPSYMTKTEEEELGQLLASATALEEVSFHSQVLHLRTSDAENDATFVQELLLSCWNLQQLEVIPSTIPAEVISTVLARPESRLSILKLGSRRRALSLQDVQHICTGLGASSVIKDLSLTMGGHLSPPQSIVFGECLAQSNTLLDFEVALENSPSEQDTQLQVCQALANGLAQNICLRRFAYFCKVGVAASPTLAMTAPFSQALESNKTLERIEIGSRKKISQLDSSGRMYLSMNQLGRQYFVDPSFRFDLWPWILAKIENAQVLYHVVRSVPTIAYSKIHAQS